MREDATRSRAVERGGTALPDPEGPRATFTSSSVRSARGPMDVSSGIPPIDD